MISILKRHWLNLLLVLVIIYLGSRSYFGVTPFQRSASNIGVFSGTDVMLSAPSAGIKSMPYYEAAPTDTVDRLVIADSHLSLVVNDVAQRIKQLEDTAKSFGGFLVSSTLSQPESAASGTLVVRVPEDKRSEVMSAFKNQSVKVVSESVNADDVTDRYVDLESRLAILNQTKTKYQEILNRAVTVADLLSVERELTNLQSQIDSLVGQQKYLEQSAKLTRITAYLSTDELALPYSPSDEWRPAVIFKTAVRSLIGTFRSAGNILIWAVVYLPIFALLYIVIRIVKRLVPKAR